ncbi:hypothetical protein PF001_g5390 [Phytophthora fragariae]|uniref:Uncharacterized protein n=1 Tax=Phytophthora fragariae TaxID=53985 RepID=A0A6A4EN13_9STRA|nr:hypothetical protein PF006_g8611 [Phytophthora fragariae]KAE9320497.1 hypothetical protein PF001_g5390 [Phytophthora fragariae]
MTTSVLFGGKGSCKPLSSAPFDQIRQPEPTSPSVTHTGSSLRKQRRIDLFQLPAQVKQSLEAKLEAEEAARDSRIAEVLLRHGIAVPDMLLTISRDNNAIIQHRLHSGKQRAFSVLQTHHGFSLEQVVELARGQTPEDPRPNKALSPKRLHRLLTGYKHRDVICRAARLGLDPEWSLPEPDQRHIPLNHKSADIHFNTVVKSVRAGQDGGQYLVLDECVLKKLDNIQISPFGAVPKAHSDPQLETLLIHDLSFPAGKSTNDASIKSSFPEIQYRHVAAVAQQIEACYKRDPFVTVYIMRCQRSVQAFNANCSQRKMDGCTDPATGSDYYRYVGSV